MKILVKYSTIDDWQYNLGRKKKYKNTATEIKPFGATTTSGVPAQYAPATQMHNVYY